MLKCFVSIFLDMTLMSNALNTSNLKKTYANDLEALKGIDLSIKKGDFFALLGSNGAGKTTAIGIICGLLNKTSGGVEVFGLNQDSHVNEIKRLIGLMPQEFNFNPFEPIEEILINQAGYHGITRSQARENAEELLKKVELWDKRKDMAKSLSGGMKRRLMMARALIHKPKILILDEPTAGVDVEIRRSMWEFLTELNNNGLTIILTTHYLEEAESLCRNIAILDNGEIVSQSSMKELLSKVSQQTLILESTEILPKDINIDGFVCTKLDEHSVQVIVDKDLSITDVVESLSDQGVKVKHIRSVQNRLETLFLSLTSGGN